MFGLITYELENNPIIQKLTTNSYKSLLKTLTHANRPIERKKSIAGLEEDAATGFVNQLEESMTSLNKFIGKALGKSVESEQTPKKDSIDTKENDQTTENDEFYELILLLPHTPSTYQLPDPLTLKSLYSYIAYYCPNSGKLISLNGIRMKKNENKLFIIDNPFLKESSNLSREKQLEISKNPIPFFNNEENWNTTDDQRIVLVLRESWVSWLEDKKSFEIVSDFKSGTQLETKSDDTIYLKNPQEKFKLFLISNVIEPEIIDPNKTQTIPEKNSQDIGSPYIKKNNGPYKFQDFVDKMNHKSNSNLSKKLKAFFDEVNKGPYTKTLQRKVRRFIDTITKDFEKHPHWKDSSELEMENTREGIEIYVMTKIFNKCFNIEEDEKIDQQLSYRISCFQSLKPSSLEIDPRIIESPHWNKAKQELIDLNNVKSPKGKMSHISNCCILIFQILQELNPNESAGADTFLPVLLYLVLQTNPERLHSNIKYINDYRNPEKLISEAGYFLTNFQGAETFWLTCDPVQLNLSQEEFDKLLGNIENQVFEKEIKISQDDNIVEESSEVSISSNGSNNINDFPNENGTIKKSETKIINKVDIQDKNLEKEYFFVPNREKELNTNQILTFLDDISSEIDDYFHQVDDYYLERSFSTMTITDLEKVFQQYKDMTNLLNHIQNNLENFRS